MPPESRSPGDHQRVRVTVVDDHPIVLAGIVSLLEREPDFHVIERCSTGVAAIEAVTRERPDVLLLDVQMPAPNGLAVLRELRHRAIDTRVILLTASVHDDDVLEAVRLGIRGLLPKETLTDDVVRCIRQVMRGETCLDPALVGRAMAALLTREAALREVAAILTPQEIKVARMLSGGLKNKEIAERLFVSEGTIKVHLHRIYEKLGISSREELVAYARDKKLT
jgi:DNA-binding NarL/FixJ family response regulator